MIIVGIDPDLHKSGVAARRGTDWLMLRAIPNAELIQELLKMCPISETIVKVEAGWKVKKANYRPGSPRKAQAIARKVGENHATGKLLASMLIAVGYKVEQIKPLKKGPLKRDGRWTQAGKDYIQGITGKVKINDDVRDAVFIARL